MKTKLDQFLIMNHIQFTIVESWNTNSIVRLYKEAGWWKEEYSPDEIPGLIKASYRFIVGIDVTSGETIAMGRIISDGISIGIIQDLCVHSDFRGKGIGQALLQSLVNEARKAGLLKIMLVAEPNTESFYKKSCFISNKNQIFLLHSR
jgi:ribosomal protein S18 acetylase RimI-like enzyme